MVLPIGESKRNEPLIILVPGQAPRARGQASPTAGDRADWIRDWRLQDDSSHEIDLGMWDNPHRNTWVNKLNLAIHRADRPVVLVAEGITCLAVAWWVEFEEPAFAEPVIGAVLVSPPDVDRPGSDPRLARFGSCPRRTLPFPAYVVANSADRAEQRLTSRQLAEDWGAGFVETAFAASQAPIDDHLLRRLTRDYRRAPYSGAGLDRYAPRY